MNKCGCGCKAVLSLNTKSNSVIQIKDRDEPFLNMNTKDKGVDATINGVTTLTLTATDGIELVQDGDVATITGQPLKDEISGVASDLGEETINRQNADSNLQNQIDSISGDLSNYRTAAQQDIIDNNLQTQINANTDRFNNYRTASQQNTIDQNLQSQITSNTNKFANYRTKADQDVIDNAQDIAIAGKQTQLTQAQLNAVNSGANTTNIGQITTNKNAIGTLSNLTTTNRTDLVSAVNEINGVAGTALQPADIVDSVESTSTDKALSANMGKELQDQVDNLKSRGRFLALWNCATGLAESNPPTGTYTYQSGDYFIIGNVAQAGGTNYKPDGSSYTTGVASTTVETQAVDTDDVYYYDGSVWRLQVNTQKTVSFDNIAGSPYDNSNLSSALGDKQNTLTQGSGISIDSSTDTISNSGVRSISTGVTNGTISVNTNGTSAEVAVAGLGSAAYTASTDYATSTQGGKADTALQPNDNITELNNNAGYITSAALSGYEQTTNKVTSLSSSSTDTEYPSAKCMWDLIGDIEATINAIRGV